MRAIVQRVKSASVTVSGRETGCIEKGFLVYNDFIGELKKKGIKVATGAFQEMMEVSLLNDGPVTFILDSKKLF